MKTKAVTGIMMILIIASVLYGAFNAPPMLRVGATTEDYTFIDLGYFIDAVGTYFDITNSTYLNITLTSSETIHVILYSVPRVVSFFIESNSSANSTILTSLGFEPSTTYYRYEDGYLVDDFTTDSSGGYAYAQDISQSHHVLIQEETSTLYITSDYTFTEDIHQRIIVAADNIVIDGNGYTLKGSGYGYGFYLLGRSNVTIRNTIIKSWSDGITQIVCSNNTIERNIISDNGNGIFQSMSHSNIIEGNAISNNTNGGMFLERFDNNIIEGNTVCNNMYGVYLMWANGNMIYHNNFMGNYYRQIVSYWSVNTWDDGYPSGGNYWSNYNGIDLYSGPYQNETGSDGIGDTPYQVGISNEDRFPFMNEIGRLTPQQTTQNEILVIESWDLNSGFERCLTSKLESAIGLLNKGNINGAIHKLQDLIKKVTNDATHLTQEQKDYIIQTTQEIIDDIA